MSRVCNHFELSYWWASQCRATSRTLALPTTLTRSAFLHQDTGTWLIPHSYHVPPCLTSEKQGKLGRNNVWNIRGQKLIRGNHQIMRHLPLLVRWNSHRYLVKREVAPSLQWIENTVSTVTNTPRIFFFFEWDVVFQISCFKITIMQWSSTECACVWIHMIYTSPTINN